MEGQVEAFRRVGLEFRLMEELLDEAEIVAFRGHLRLEGPERRTPAIVIYPPGFHLGEHPTVIAPDLDVGRHRSPHGELCLDHAAPGAKKPMSGAEAVLRAERLWWLWENDREQLAAEEIDAPEPWAPYVQHASGSAVALAALAVPAEAKSGTVELGLTSFRPLRGSVRVLRVSEPALTRVKAGSPGDVLAGEMELRGPWRRLARRPPVCDEYEACDWVLREHSGMLREAALELRGSDAHMPFLLAFTYPDEGPGRNETHDAWLFVAIRPSGQFELPRPLAVSREGQWPRQPGMAKLEHKRVAVAGVGALGSQIASLLARAGVGAFSLIDSDLSMPGNRVRHDLDLSAIGHDKVHAQRERILRLNPWARVDVRAARLGTLALGVSFSSLQRADDELAARLADADLIVNATASPSAGSYISAIAAEARTPTLHVWVSAGSWGGRILVQSAGKSACSDCFGAWQGKRTARPPEPIPALSQEPRSQAVQELGCADVTFTGAGFELTSAAAAAARVATQELLKGEGYPPRTFDLATLTFREHNRALPGTTYTSLPPYPGCTTCGTSTATAPHN